MHLFGVAPFQHSQLVVNVTSARTAVMQIDQSEKSRNLCFIYLHQVIHRNLGGQIDLLYKYCIIDNSNLIIQRETYFCIKTSSAYVDYKAQFCIKFLCAVYMKDVNLLAVSLQLDIFEANSILQPLD